MAMADSEIPGETPAAETPVEGPAAVETAGAETPAEQPEAVDTAAAQTLAEKQEAVETAAAETPAEESEAFAADSQAPGPGAQADTGTETAEPNESQDI
jgi:hypothetical protein